MIAHPELLRLHPFEQMHSLAEGFIQLHVEQMPTPAPNQIHHVDLESNLGNPHSIELKKAHLCSADCLDHRHHDNFIHVEGHSHETHSEHTIIQKSTEHACGADCPTHSHAHYSSHGHHEHTTNEQARNHEHHIEHKSHACSTYCPEHGSGHSHINNQHEHHHDHRIEQKSHICSPDCPEHGHTQARYIHETHHVHARDDHPPITNEQEGNTSHAFEVQQVNSKRQLHDAALQYQRIEAAISQAYVVETEKHTRQQSEPELRQADTMPTRLVAEKLTTAAFIEHPARPKLQKLFARSEVTDIITETSATRIVSQSEKSKNGSELSAEVALATDNGATISAEKLDGFTESPSLYKDQGAVEASFGQNMALACRFHTENKVGSYVLSGEDALVVSSKTEMPVQIEATDGTRTLPETINILSGASVILSGASVSEANVSSEPNDEDAAYVGLLAITDALEQSAGIEVIEQLESFGVEPVQLPLPQFVSQADYKPFDRREHSLNVDSIIHDQTESLNGAIEQSEPVVLKEAASTLAGTICQRIEEIYEQTLTVAPKRAEAIQITLHMLSVLKTASYGERGFKVFQQHFVYLLWLLGYENPAHSLQAYTHQYGYGFLDELLTQLIEFLSQNYSIESQYIKASDPAPIQSNVKANVLGMFVLGILKFRRYFTSANNFAQSIPLA